MIKQFFWSIVGTLKGTTTLVQSNGNEGVVHIPKSSSIGASLSDGLVSYPEYSLEWVLLLCKDAVGIFYSSSRVS